MFLHKHNNIQNNILEFEFDEKEMEEEKGLIYIIHNSVLFCANADPVMVTADSWEINKFLA